MEFVCILNRRDAYPAWNIDGTDYQITDLPFGYDFMSVSYSNVLIVTSVQREMNNSWYYCYVVTLQGRMESERATLIIQLLPNTTSKYPCNYKKVYTFVDFLFYCIAIGSSTVLSSDDIIILSATESYIAPNIYYTEPQLMIQTSYSVYLIQTKILYVNQTGIQSIGTSIDETQLSQPSTDHEVIGKDYILHGACLDMLL